MNKKGLSLLMCGALTLSMATPALAVEDLSGHWAKDALETWKDYGVLQGDENGDLRPDSSITRGELAVILDRVMAYQAKAANRFTDLNDSWYTDAILGASAAGILQGYEDGTVKPKAAITRQEAAVMFARVLALDTQGAPSAGYTDQNSIGFWALGAVNAMTAAGYLQGSGNLFRPQDSITRAEVVTILDNIFASNFNESGEYTGDVDGSAVINAGQVVLRDMYIEGDLIVAEGVADGHVELDNVTVNGRLIVRGGGENSIVVKGESRVSRVVVARQDSRVRVAVEDGASVNTIAVQEGSDAVTIEGSVSVVTIEGTGAAVSVTGSVDTVTVTASASGAALTVASGAEIGTLTTAAANASLSLSGKVDAVTVTGSATDVTVASGAAVGSVTTQAAGTNLSVSGKVDSVTVTETASGTNVTAESGAQIDSVTTAGANTTVSGEGTVSKVEAAPGSTGTTVTTGGTKVENNSSESVSTGSGSVDAGSSGTTSSGSNNGGTGGGGSVVPPDEDTSDAQKVTTQDELIAALESDSGASKVQVAGDITLDQNIEIPAGKTLIVSAGGALDAFESVVSGAGTVRVEAGGVLKMNANYNGGSDSMLPTVSALTVAHGGVLKSMTTNNDSGSNTETIFVGPESSARIQTASGASVTFRFSETYSGTRPSLSLDGSCTIPSGNTWYSMFDSATEAIGIDMILTSGTLTVEGTLKLADANGTGSTLTVASGAAVDNNGTLSVGSLVTLTNQGSLVNRGSLTNHGTITNNGTLDNQGSLTNNGTIDGSGEVLDQNSVTRNGLTLSFEAEGSVSAAEELHETQSGEITDFLKPGSADLKVSLQAASGVSKNVRITVTDVKKDGGDTQAIQVIAVDTDDKAWNILETGWGPMGGFPAPTDKTTTECYITATEAGTYTAMVNVVDAGDSSVLVSLPITIVVE